MGTQKSTPKDFNVSVSGIAGFFDTASEVAKTAGDRRYYDGGAIDPDILFDRAQLGDLTVRRGWANSRDFAVAKTMMGYVGNQAKSWTITKQPTVGGQRSGSPIIYTGYLKGCTDPATDSNGASDPVMLELVFALSKRA